MTETNSGELSGEAKRALSHLFPLIGHWRQRMESAPTPPETGSSLLKDDQAAHPYLVSQAVSAQLVSAADHWDALRALLQEAQVVHARAPFTLLRAAIENAAAAVWLLAPASRDARILRKLRLEWKNFLDQENAEELVTGQSQTSRAGRKAELQRIARARGLSEEMVSQVASTPVAFRAIVQAAASDAPRCGLTDVQALYCWMAASGIAHAQRWAVMCSSALERTTIPGAPREAPGWRYPRPGRHSWGSPTSGPHSRLKAGGSSTNAAGATFGNRSADIPESVMVSSPPQARKTALADLWRDVMAAELRTATLTLMGHNRYPLLVSSAR